MENNEYIITLRLNSHDKRNLSLRFHSVESDLIKAKAEFIGHLGKALNAHNKKARFCKDKATFKFALLERMNDGAELSAGEKEESYLFKFSCGEEEGEYAYYHNFTKICGDAQTALYALLTPQLLASATLTNQYYSSTAD